VHSLLYLAEQYGATSDQMQGPRYSESEVEIDMTVLELEMDMTASGQVVCQEILNQEQYSVD
jgi:hypothetical protein